MTEPDSDLAGKPSLQRVIKELGLEKGRLHVMGRLAEQDLGDLVFVSPLLLLEHLWVTNSQGPDTLFEVKGRVHPRQ